MPRRKKTSCNPRRDQLLFLESAREGPLHEYGSIPQKADHPICASTKPLEHNASTSWVSPQFDQTAELHFPGRRRQQHTSFSSTLQSRTREASHSELRAPGRNARVCRFPSLSFTGRRASTARTDALCARRRPALPAQTEGGSSVPWSSPPQQASCTRVVSPPDIDTPQTTPKSERNAQFQYEMEDTRIQVPKGRDGHCGNYDTPVAVGPGMVLAEDTPEQEYGVRITWRRRQQLMRYLKERGRLNSSQILVKR